MRNSIFKKGETDDPANYRPISLLNTLYKIYASLIQKRIADAIDDKLQTTQYGFRPNRGTAEAIQYIRRMVDKEESRNSNTLLVLLVWEKAVDKVTHHMLIYTLVRMNIPEKIINIIKAIYKNPCFCVSLDGKTSDWYKQETGMRQGCPLSLYLFLIVMTAMFHDIHQELEEELAAHRIPGAEFDEVTYADDTICITTDADILNKFTQKRTSISIFNTANFKLNIL